MSGMIWVVVLSRPCKYGLRVHFSRAILKVMSLRIAGWSVSDPYVLVYVWRSYSSITLKVLKQVVVLLGVFIGILEWCTMSGMTYEDKLTLLQVTRKIVWYGIVLSCTDRNQ